MSKTIIVYPKLSIFSIPQSYISGDSLLIPSTPDWTTTPQSNINMFFGWKAYIK